MHKCDADCWSHMLRYGTPEGCDPFEARAAADAEADELPPGWE